MGINWWWVLLPLDTIMTRSIFAAALALTPSLLFAQATSPAPTSSQAVLQARVAAPADLKSANPKTSTGSTVRVSTGIVAPKLTDPVTLSAETGAQIHILAKDVTVVLSLVVDETGKPTNVAVSQSAGTTIDQEVLAAISRQRFQPGTLDGQPYALPVRLQVVIEHGTQY